MTTPRLSGPCSHGDHQYCLGPRMILPCTCTCHEHTDPEQRRQVNTHTTKTERLPDGSVKASCTCGWASRWPVADGSAQEDASMHEHQARRNQ